MSGFALDEGTMRSLVQGWVDLAAEYRDAMARAPGVQPMEPPGRDFASQAHAAVANASSREHLKYLEVAFQYCVIQAQRFQDTLDEYLGAEERTVIEIKRSGTEAGI